MTPYESALELAALAREDEQAAVLDTAAIGDALVGFHYQQAVENDTEGPVGRAGRGFSQDA